ncbi:3-methyl-2-oxobutanoate dehydrogenase subunit VorB [Synergistaceae bacterium OttesenSCG-928-D05]|nr:3-methyl-2-oxobutanoate dehydrogenase subunit VorB [Synergistaceae bacterium OttesenSCG-928-D05]
MEKTLMKGTEAIAEAAVQAGCKYFFGYPITPQNEIPEYMSKRLPEVGGVYLQAESELAASNMLLGAAAVGERVMTSSSSPGISLMSEAVSYMAGQELPVVIVNVMRAGPGLGGILPSQADYNQATCGIGHGDFNLIVLAPGSLQETVNLMQKAFDLAEKYRNPVLVICDGVIGQIMEAVEIPNGTGARYTNPVEWAAGYMDKRGSSVIVRSLYLDAEDLEAHNRKLEAKWRTIVENETMCEKYRTEDAKLVISAFGTVARIARSVVNNLREEGMQVGLIRPIVVSPFPVADFESLSPTCKHILDTEMNWGQMLRDVKAGVRYNIPVSFYGRSGGFCPSEQEIEDECRRLYAELG